MDSMNDEFSSRPVAKNELRLVSRLRLNEDHAAALLRAMREGNASRRAIVLSPRAPVDYAPPFSCADRSFFPWLPERVYLPADDASPTSCEDYARGMYYVLDLSSCWEGAALSALTEPPRRSIDLCAAPGGKTLLLAAQFPLHDHTANEVHSARRGILRHNVELCGLSNTRVTGLRPDQWAESGEKLDLLLVDAPCSGQSLLCKGIKNPGCLGAAAVQGNAKRQRGIMLCAVRCAAPGAHLLYTTCTYDPEENERVIAYILRRVPGWSAVEIPVLAPFRSTLCDFPAYRLLPHHGAGAGGFCCLLRKTESPES